MNKTAYGNRQPERLQGSRRAECGREPFEESPGNIFADLGLADSDELYARAQIGVHVFKILKDKKQRDYTAGQGFTTG